MEYSDFSAPSTVVYVVDGSLNSSFSTIDWSSGETSNNHISIPVGDILLIADNAGVMPGDVFDVHLELQLMLDLVEVPTQSVLYRQEFL
ncbi:MAG: hypothetical protein CM15mP32_6120 [Flavobacteriaceae bacterium]|nr:MAG: hypothetical protein CM15mP32_6120 [Flavobacteriaceae bacterium]